jgi:YggT family protein
MISQILLQFVALFVTVFNILLLVRVIASWVNPHPTGGIMMLLFDLTEPVLAPIRKVLPQSQMIDFSPLVAFLILQILGQFASQALAP